MVNYLHNFDRSKFDIRVVLPRDSQLIPFVTAEHYPVIEIENGRDRSFDMKAVGEIKKIIKEWKPDIVHTHSAFSGKLAAWLCRVPCRFYTRHSAFPPSKKLTTFPGRQINGLVNNTLATDIVAVAEAAKKNLTDTGVNAKKITVIINGSEEVRRISPKENLTLKQELKIPESAFVCGISARLEPYKGHATLLDAAKTVVNKYPDVVFLIIGSGSCDSALKDQAASLGIADKIRFVGFVNDVAPYYNIMNLNLNCSWGTETSCLALSEGMSLGLPAIATTYGGNPYMITEGVNGILVPEKDPAALSEAILSLIRDRDLLAKYAVGARAMYEEKFTARGMTEQLEVLYEASVNRHRK